MELVPALAESIYKFFNLDVACNQCYASVRSSDAYAIRLHHCATGTRPNLWKIVEKDEKIFTRMLTQAAICGMIAVDDIVRLLWGCGCSGGGSPSAYFFALPCPVLRGQVVITIL